MAVLAKLGKLGDPARLRDLWQRGYRLGPRELLATARLWAATGFGPTPAAVAAWPTALRLAAGSSLEVAPGGRLLLGGASQRVFDVDRVRNVLVLRRGTTLAVGGRVRLGLGTKVRLDPGARLEIGHRTYTGANCVLWAAEGTEVRIGSGCAISWGVQVLGTSAHRILGGRPMSGPITIGDDVWLGAQSVVLPGVSIGAGAVVGARSVVTRDVPPRAIVAGAPARVVDEDVTWQR